MGMKTFGLIGDGKIAEKHRRSIAKFGHFEFIYDPIKMQFQSKLSLQKYLNKCPSVDYYVIASPSDFHRQQTQIILNHIGNSDSQIIVEKPAVLPWEPLIDSSKINVVLQLRYLPGLPEKADSVKAVFVRDEAYFKTWKGDARKTGGLFLNLFIHFIDLAIQLDADFEGLVIPKGNQEKYIQHRSEGHKTQRFIMPNEIQTCYDLMYEDILSDGGIKPKELFYLNWILQRNSEIFGYGKEAMNKVIRIGKELM